MLRTRWILLFHRNGANELTVPNAMTRDDLGSVHVAQTWVRSCVNLATINTFESSKRRIERSVRNVRHSDTFDSDFSANF